MTDDKQGRCAVPVVLAPGAGCPGDRPEDGARRSAPSLACSRTRRRPTGSRTPDVPGDAFGVFHFRHALDLRGAAERFAVHVSADNRYRLFVNGRQVSSGPEALLGPDALAIRDPGSRAAPARGPERPSRARLELGCGTTGRTVQPPQRLPPPGRQRARGARQHRSRVEGPPRHRLPAGTGALAGLLRLASGRGGGR